MNFWDHNIDLNPTSHIKSFKELHAFCRRAYKDFEELRDAPLLTAPKVRTPDSSINPDLSATSSVSLAEGDFGVEH